MRTAPEAGMRRSLSLGRFLDECSCPFGLKQWLSMEGTCRMRRGLPLGRFVGGCPRDSGLAGP